MSKKTLSGIAVIFFLVLTIQTGQSAIWCANNSTDPIHFYERCENTTTEPCIGWDANLSLFNFDGVTVNYSVIMNETSRGFYNCSIPNPGVIGRYRLEVWANDSTTISSGEYDILSIQEYCLGEGMAELTSSLDLNWTQLWDYFNCTNATSDLNDICHHLDTIISDLSDVADDVEDIEDDTGDIKSDVRKIKIATQPKVTGWTILGNWIMQYRYYILLGIGIIIFLVVVVIGRKLRKASSEEGFIPEGEEYG